MKRILVTGVTSGIGEALLRHYVNQGHFVIGIARNQKKIDALSKSIKEANYKIYRADFSALKSVRSLSEKIHEAYGDGLDILINNAGLVSSGKTFTEDGFELQYQVNHLSGVLLTLNLSPLLMKRNGRVIMTGSDAHKKARFEREDIEALTHYHAIRSYARTKLYNLMFAHWLNASPKTPHCYVVSPGRVKTPIGTKDTSVFHATFWKLFTYFGKGPEKVIKTYDYLIKTPSSELTATYYHDAKVHEESPLAQHQSNIDALMDKTLKDLNLDQ